MFADRIAELHLLLTKPGLTDWWRRRYEAELAQLVAARDAHADARKAQDYAERAANNTEPQLKA